jgi:hypothetical protein
MGIKTSSQLANLQRSLDTYFATELSTYQIDWEGVPFNDSELAEWLQPRLLEPVRRAELFYRQVSGEDRGQGIELFYNVNIFIRPRKFVPVNPYRLAQLRDTVLNVFTESTRIWVRDYEGDLTSMGTLTVHAIATDRRVVDPRLSDELLQWNLTPVLRWIESWTA